MDLLKRHPPVLLVETKHERVNMISAITKQGHVRFMVYEEKTNQQRLWCVAPVVVFGKAENDCFSNQATAQSSAFK